MEASGGEEIACALPERAELVWGLGTIIAASG